MTRTIIVCPDGRGGGGGGGGGSNGSHYIGGSSWNQVFYVGYDEPYRNQQRKKLVC